MSMLYPGLKATKIFSLHWKYTKCSYSVASEEKYIWNTDFSLFCGFFYLTDMNIVADHPSSLEEGRN